MNNGTLDYALFDNSGNLDFKVGLSPFKKLCVICFIETRKFYVRRKNNKVDSIETGRIVIAHLLP